MHKEQEKGLNYGEKLVIGLSVLFVPLLAIVVLYKCISIRRDNPEKAELLNKINIFAVLCGITMYCISYIGYYNGDMCNMSLPEALCALGFVGAFFLILMSIALASSTFSATNMQDNAAASFSATNMQDNAAASSVDAVAKHFEGYVSRANVEEYLNSLQQRADGGEASAQTELGRLLLWGHIIPRDIEKSTFLFRQAAEQGDVIGLFALGMAYINGDGAQKDHVEALKWIQKAADQNSPIALEALGNFFADGTVVQQDYAEAVRLWLKAAELGYCKAMLNLAFHYAKQIGDKREATKWFFRAYLYGDDMAAAVLMATLQRDSLGDNLHDNIEQNPKDISASVDNSDLEQLASYVERTNVVKYLDDLRNRANSGDALAQTELGDYLLRGTLIPFDSEEAMRLFAQAANQGNADAQWQLGRGYKYGEGLPENQDEAYKWFKKSAEQDYPPALNTLGNYVVHGIGVKQDFDEAARLWHKAADLGNGEGMFNLAGYYANQAIDKLEATKWFFNAYFHGSDLSASILKNALQGKK